MWNQQRLHSQPCFQPWTSTNGQDLKLQLSQIVSIPDGLSEQLKQSHNTYSIPLRFGFNAFVFSTMHAILVPSLDFPLIVFALLVPIEYFLHQKCNFLVVLVTKNKLLEPNRNETVSYETAFAFHWWWSRLLPLMINFLGK